MRRAGAGLHDPIPSQRQWLRQVVTGFFAYHAVPTNLDALAAFRYHIMVLWMRTLMRRSQKDRTGWDRINRLADQWLLRPRILHPWPGKDCRVATRTMLCRCESPSPRQSAAPHTRDTALPRPRDAGACEAERD